MQRLSLAIATILLFSPFITALPTPPPNHYGRYGTGRLNPDFVGYHGVPVGYGGNAQRVDEINHERLAGGHDVVQQLGHFHDGVRPSNCERGFCTHGETAHGGHPPRDYLQGSPYRYNDHSTPSTSSGRGGHGTPCWNSGRIKRLRDHLEEILASTSRPPRSYYIITVLNSRTKYK
ncbi:hypothetical protein F5887DRAFT_1073852 [Amanita rubescens]|nr:hypothetical protein F5887DRAFT_1073852 [Amanita rubescens]